MTVGGRRWAVGGKKPPPAAVVFLPAACRLLPTAYRRSGFTLTEILVVIAIIGLLMGIGVASWLRFRSGSRLQEAHQQLAASARRARFFALEESAGGRLVLDRPGRSFHCEGLRLVGMWNFEGPDMIGGPKVTLRSEEQGFVGRVCENSGGARTLAAGYHGKGLRFSGPGGLLFPEEDFRFHTGGELTCFLYPEVDSASQGVRQTIFARGKELEFYINTRGELQARSGKAEAITAGYRVVAGRWTQVSFFFSPEAVRIAADGVVRASAAEGDLPNKKEESLLLAFSDDKSFPFIGCVDEVALRRPVREALYRLGGAVEFAPGAPDEVRFDALGGLDRRAHAGPVRIGLRMPEVSAPDGYVTRWVTISMDGEVREE